MHMNKTYRQYTIGWFISIDFGQSEIGLLSAYKSSLEWIHPKLLHSHIWEDFQKNYNKKNAMKYIKNDTICINWSIKKQNTLWLIEQRDL